MLNVKLVSYVRIPYAIIISRVVLRNYKVMGSKKICAIFDIAHIFLDPISTYLVCPCEINNVLFWAGQIFSTNDIINNIILLSSIV